MNAPVWIFVTVLIVVCILIGFGILAVILVSLTDDNHVSLTDAEAATKAAGTVKEEQEQEITTTTRAEAEAEAEERTDVVSTAKQHKNTINSVDWSSDEAVLRATFVAFKAASVRFVLRKTTIDDRFPLWTSNTVKVLDKNKEITFTTPIRDGKIIAIFNVVFETTTTKTEMKHEQQYVMEMENAETYEMLAYALLPTL